MDPTGRLTSFPALQFGSISIGPESPTVIIAEAACEHLGNLDIAMRMADAAKDAGVDIIKFQLHVAEEMLPHSIRFWAGEMDDILEKVNLPIEKQAQLKEYCTSIGIQYLCTPFSAMASDLLEEIGIDAYKIGSGEMTNLPMLRHIATKGKPMIVSTGMADLGEIGSTVNALRAAEADFMLMNCTSAYPPRYDQINLGLIPELEARFNVLVGHSDHTPDGWTCLGAVAIGARAIEKHFTLDRRLKGPDHHVSLEPDEFASLVHGIRKLEEALGAEKTIHPEEKVVREWAHHSVVTLVGIRAGSTITPDLVGVKRPGTGIPASRLESVYGRVARRDIPANVAVQWHDLVEPS